MFNCVHRKCEPVLFASYPDEVFMYCDKHEVTITPEWDQSLVCNECKGCWDRDQIMDFVYGEDDD